MITAKSSGKYWAFHCTIFSTLCILDNFHNKNLMNLTENPKLLFVIPKSKSISIKAIDWTSEINITCTLQISNSEESNVVTVINC